MQLEKDTKRESEVFVNQDLLLFDNDASASSFGWNFQTNAALFLTSYYWRDLESTKVESKLQDIEIHRRGLPPVYAQAKSWQTVAETQDAQKSLDAFASLCITHAKEPDAIFLFIHNHIDYWKWETLKLRDKVCSYSNLSPQTQAQIQDLFTRLKGRLLKRERELDAAGRLGETIGKKVQATICAVDDFDLEKLHLCVITDYYGEDQSRYVAIEFQFTKMLTELGLDITRARIVASKMLCFYQNYFAHNATISDEDSLSKTINNKEFFWPAVFCIVEDSKDEFEEIFETCTPPPDESLLLAARESWNDLRHYYHERFAFTNQVLGDYFRLRKENKISDAKDFVAKRWKDFVSEFAPLVSSGEDVLELIVKRFLYHILISHRVVSEVMQKAGLTNDH